ncbi:MAG: hypothetical protein HND44_24550 [Chloroflexi bacterium]|nr:hypothetical protein [Ardenticatenaceae bacterium]NOG37705.1 hypothetical protein [Chloroflexota bacterium]
MSQLATGKEQAFLNASVDRIHVATNEDYTTPLTQFFAQRAMRIRH